MLPRAVRNNNPGNMDAGPWQGVLTREQMTPEQRAEPRFAVFQSPEWGFRAMAKQLRVYEIAHHCNTVRQFINRWAPPVENDTGAYVADVAAAVGVKPDDIIDVNQHARMFAMCKAITRHETGSWEPYWNDDQLTKGLALAGI